MSVRKHIIMTEELAEQIRKFRFRSEISSEARAINLLLEAGLKAFSGENNAAFENRTGPGETLRRGPQQALANQETD